MSGAVECGKLDARNGDEVVLCTAVGEAIAARVSMPEGNPPPGGWPGVVVLHGSGGLFQDAKDDACSEEMDGRFQEWADILNDQGYATIFPASFYSRGYCEWWDRDKSTDGDKGDRLIDRIYDAAAAGQWLCHDYRVDCSRLAVLGFSNGGSTTVLIMHEDLRDAEEPSLAELPMPKFVGGVAYYPGCGLQGQLSASLDEEDFGQYYFPKGQMWVPHAERDSLLDDCEEIRDPQVDAVAEYRGIEEDMFELKAYDSAKHGFDGADDDDREEDVRARNQAQARTLEKLAEWFE